MLVVTLVTIILHNLALAVIVGVIVSALVLLGITQNVFGRERPQTNKGLSIMKYMDHYFLAR
jgi:MFS superfamily sulfate permease-like transporter